MLLASVSIPAYTFKPSDLTITREKNRRYTMKDIGKIEQRLGHVEYYTSLNLLERDAESFQIQDANGLDRFKSGFIADSFSGHSVGDVKHGDYSCSIDMELNEMRPQCVPKGIKLQESVTSDLFLSDDHIVVLDSDNILESQEDLWERLRRTYSQWPKSVNLITGPSKTADVEQTIEYGAHGPRRVHVIVCNLDK